jgi:predicted DNA-binding protein
LPKAKSEPVYVKSDCERELEAAQKEARSWVGRDPACINTYKEERLFQSKRNDRPVLLNLPVQILEQVDRAVSEQGVTRSQFLRQAIERNLRHYQNFERAIFRRIYQQGMS